MMNRLQNTKWLPAILLALAMTEGTSRAQNPPPPAAAPLQARPIHAGGAAAANPAEAGELTFNLDFPGGTVVEFMEALKAARGRPVNILIDEADQALQIPRIRMQQVSIGSLMQAINRLGRSREQAFVFESANSPAPGETVWSLSVVRRNPEATGQVRFFNLEAYLTKNSVEDITTALNAGYQLKTGTNDRLALKYHKETNLLMVRGSPEDLELVANVLSQLRPSQPPPKFPAAAK